MSTDLLNLNLRVWRQAGPKDKGGFKTYRLNEKNRWRSITTAAKGFVACAA